MIDPTTGDRKRRGVPTGKRLTRKASSLAYEGRVALAMKIIGSDARRDLVEPAMRFETGFVRRLKTYKQSGRYGVLSKKQKEAAAGLEVALHKLETALKNVETTGLHHWLVNLPDQKDVEHWRKDAKEAAETKIGPQSPGNPAKFYAAEVAARLLEKHGIRLSLGRSGQFCKLAAVIYGDPKEDFLHHCRAIGPDRNRAQKTSG